MLNISDELKLIYKNDQFPYLDSVVPKELIIYFPELDLTIETDQIVDDSFSLSESLCSTDEITLGACEAAKIKFTLADVNQDLTGKEFTITQTVNEIYSMPLGTFTVDSCKKQDDLRFKEITAYNSMKKTDVNVADWYNGLEFPISAKDMRESLLTYLGMDFEEQDLPNDDIMIEKTISPSSLIGREVLKCLCELAGGFGQINRENKFHVKRLSTMGLYPSETLYPSEDLFPAESGEFLTAGYRETRYEEYIVEPITKLQIHQDDEDEGVVVGSGDNTYTITGNFLLYGKSAEELETIAHNILLQVANKFYRPHTTQLIGLPYMEVGDTITIITSNDAIETFIFQRTLTGIQALQDEYTATGSQKRTNKASLSTQVEQLKGKTLRIQKDVEGVQVEVEDVEQRLIGELNVLAGQVVLKVDANGNIAAVELDADPEEGTSIKLKADNIELEGLVTANARFKILTDGSMEAVNGKFSGNITGGTISGVVFRSNFDELDPNEAYMLLDSGFLKFFADGGREFIRMSHSGVIGMTGGYDGDLRTLKILPSSSSVECDQLITNYLNGYIPITSQNIGGQSVAYATTAGNASNADYATISGSTTYATRLGTTNAYTYMSVNNNFRPSSDLLGSCGTSEGRFTSVYAQNGAIITSDARKKTNISALSDKYLQFARKLLKLPRTYKMTDGQSGRTHIGFIAQDVEEIMTECGITDMEFAGLIKSPVYANKLLNDDGNETDEYDTTSEIIDYKYWLRYDEFIPLIFALLDEILNND